MYCPELDPRKAVQNQCSASCPIVENAVDETADQDVFNVILRKMLLLFFVVPLLTYLVIRIPVYLCSYYREEVEKNEINSNWTETSGRITSIVHHDYIDTITVGRKWRRRTKFIKATREELEYEYRDNYGYKHDGKVIREKSTSPDWKNGRVEIIDIEPNAKDIKVFYDPKRTAYSRLNAEGTDNSYIINIIIASIITLGLFALDVAAMKYIFKRITAGRSHPLEKMA